MGFWLGDDEGLRVGFLVGFAVGKLVGLKEGDAVVGDSKGDEVVHFGRENSSSCAPHVSPTDCDHTTIPFSSDTEIIADDNRQRQWVGSLVSMHQRFNTLIESRGYDCPRSNSHQALESLVCE